MRREPGYALNGDPRSPCPNASPAAAGFVYDNNIIFDSYIKYNNFGTGFSAKELCSSAFPIDRFADKPAEDAALDGISPAAAADA